MKNQVFLKNLVSYNEKPSFFKKLGFLHQYLRQ